MGSRTFACSIYQIHYVITNADKYYELFRLAPMRIIPPPSLSTRPTRVHCTKYTQIYLVNPCNLLLFYYSGFILPARAEGKKIIHRPTINANSVWDHFLKIDWTDFVSYLLVHNTPARPSEKEILGYLSICFRKKSEQILDSYYFSFRRCFPLHTFLRTFFVFITSVRRIPKWIWRVERSNINGAYIIDT